MSDKPLVTRRSFLKAGLWGAGGLAGALVLDQARRANAQSGDGGDHGGHNGMYMAMTNGADVDHAANGFNPSDILTDFDYGKVSTLPDGRTLREYDVFAGVKTFHSSSSVAVRIYLSATAEFAAWSFILLAATSIRSTLTEMKSRRASARS